MGKKGHDCKGAGCRGCYDAERWQKRKKGMWLGRKEKKAAAAKLWLWSLFMAIKAAPKVEERWRDVARDMAWRKRRSRAVARDVKRYGREKATYHAALITKK